MNLHTGTSDELIQFWDTTSRRVDPAIIHLTLPSRINFAPYVHARRLAPKTPGR